MANIRKKEKPAECTFTIPVRPHVAKYLHHLYGSCFAMSKRNHIGLMVYYLLQKNRARKDYDNLVEGFNEKVKVTVSDGFIYDHGAAYLTSYSIFQFDSFIDSLIKNELVTFIEAHVIHGIMIKDAIAAFKMKYGFEENDISNDCLIKAYQRKKNNRSVCPPVFE